MKKIIGLLAVLFITTGVFGQKFIRSHSFIETTPTGNNTIEDAIQRGVNDNYEWIDYVHFIQNGKLYMLSYEPNEKHSYGVDRSIYLYSKDTTDIDSPWEIASNCISTSNWLDIRNYSEFDFFVYDKEQHNSSVGKVDVQENSVLITIKYELMTNGRVSISEPMTFIFRPDGENFRCYAKSSTL